MVYCPGSHTTDHLFSTTRILSIPTRVVMRGKHIALRHYNRAEAPCCELFVFSLQSGLCKHNLQLQFPRRRLLAASDWSAVREPVPVSRSAASVFCSCPRATPWCLHSVQGGLCFITAFASHHPVPVNLITLKQVTFYTIQPGSGSGLYYSL